MCVKQSVASGVDVILNLLQSVGCRDAFLGVFVEHLHQHVVDLGRGALRRDVRTAILENRFGDVGFGRLDFRFDVLDYLFFLFDYLIVLLFLLLVDFCLLGLLVLGLFQIGVGRFQIGETPLSFEDFLQNEKQ